jgi:hypothetical protein
VLPQRTDRSQSWMKFLAVLHLWDVSMVADNTTIPRLRQATLSSQLVLTEFLRSLKASTLTKPCTVLYKPPHPLDAPRVGFTRGSSPFL